MESLGSDAPNTANPIAANPPRNPFINSCKDPSLTETLSAALVSTVMVPLMTTPLASLIWNLTAALLSPSQVHSACQGIRAQGTLQDIGRGVTWTGLEFRSLGSGWKGEKTSDPSTNGDVRR